MSNNNENQDYRDIRPSIPSYHNYERSSSCKINPDLQTEENVKTDEGSNYEKK